MHRAFEAKNPFCPTSTVHFRELFVAFLWRTGHQSVQRQSSDLTLELRDEHEAEADIVVTVIRAIVVAVSGTAVLRIVVPAPTAQHTVRTHDWRPKGYKPEIILFRNSLALACSVKAINGKT